ncbi:MAG: hypothetical protein AAGK97_10185, partial [Bacteroidota bacterium]
DLSGNDLNVIYFDECTGATASYQDYDYDLGCGEQAMLREWLVSDYCGNYVIVEQLVFNDTIAPEITFRDDMLRDVVSGTIMNFECGDDNLPIMDENSVVITDDCVESLQLDFEKETTDGVCSDVGYFSSTFYRWSATDPCGNVEHLELTIQLTDMTAPEFDAPETLTVECGDEIPSPIVTDNCIEELDLTFEDEVTQGRDCDTLEIIVRTYEAIDACDNEAKFTQTIYIVNEEGPTFDHNREVLCEEFNIPVTAFDACTGALIPAELIGTTSDRDCGLTFNTYQAADNCGNVTEWTQTIVDQDTIAPELLIVNPVLNELIGSAREDVVNVNMSNQELLNAINQFAKNDVIAQDQCNLEAFVNFSRSILRNPECINGEVEVWTFLWEGLDQCGNLTPMQLIVRVFDDVPPTIFNVPSDTSVICSDAPFAAITADDNYSSVTISLDEQIRPTSNPENFTIVRTWTAVDECGNETMATQEVSVTNDVGLTCEIEVADTIFCNSHFNIATAIPTGGTGPYTYTWDVLAGECLIESGQGTEEIEFYMGFNDAIITVTIVDANGCSTTCTVTIECEDN